MPENKNQHKNGKNTKTLYFTMFFAFQVRKILFRKAIKTS